MRKIKIACVGDIMCGESFYALQQGPATSLRQYGSDFMPQAVSEYINAHDISMCNIECVLSDIRRNDSILRKAQLRGEPIAASHIAEWGFNVANLANNHILEHGKDAAVDTAKNLNNAGVATTGSGLNNDFQKGLGVTEITCENQQIAIVGFCLRQEKYAYDGGADIDQILSTINDLASQDKIVIVTIHWGDELMDRPQKKHIELAHQMTDAGATCIIGHHPHVPQGIESADGKLIAYSLGNFIFNGIHPDTRWSFILTVEIEDRKVTGFHCIPIQADSHHRPTIATAETYKEIINEINRRSALIDSASTDIDYEDKYQKDLEEITCSAKRRLRREILNRLPSFKPIYWPQILLRPIQRRLGTW